MRRSTVRLTSEADADLLRLIDFLLDKDPDAALRAEDALTEAFKLLELFPFTCRKALGGPDDAFHRELVIPFGSYGYVAMFEIEDPSTVSILAVRHQREGDYY